VKSETLTSAFPKQEALAKYDDTRQERCNYSRRLTNLPRNQRLSRSLLRYGGLILVAALPCACTLLTLCGEVKKEVSQVSLNESGCK
jgi:hypothetical protein